MMEWLVTLAPEIERERLAEAQHGRDVREALRAKQGDCDDSSMIMWRAGRLLMSLGRRLQGRGGPISDPAQARTPC